MLGSAALMAFVPVRDTTRARSFYESTLGLTVLQDSAFALVLDANGTMLRVTAVEQSQPQPFTIVGWAVNDVAATVGALAARGVAFHRYPGMEQTAAGVWTAPSGDRVAWFGDPDGNVLSLTQFAAG